MKKPKQGLPRFVPMYFTTITSPAWRALPHGARSLYLLMKRHYNRARAGAVYLSVRMAAKELGASRNTITGWIRALMAHGFIIRIERGSLGIQGRGRAAYYRLTDEPFEGNPATSNFLHGHPNNGGRKKLEPVPKTEPPCSKTEPLVAQKLSHFARKTQ